MEPKWVRKVMGHILVGDESNRWKCLATPVREQEAMSASMFVTPVR
jgi:hypothetical protein